MTNDRWVFSMWHILFFPFKLIELLGVTYHVPCDFCALYILLLLYILWVITLLFYSPIFQQPIRDQYLGHVNNVQPIRGWYLGYMVIMWLFYIRHLLSTNVYIHCACLRFSLIYFRIKVNFWLSYPKLGINHSVKKLKITLQEFKNMHIKSNLEATHEF